MAEEVRKLTQQYERDIVVHGSPQLAQTLIEHDFVDELRLMVYPVIVGAGKHFFIETTAKKNLRLVETKTFNDGHPRARLPARLSGVSDDPSASSPRFGHWRISAWPGR